jgi:hypothetical protein
MQADAVRYTASRHLRRPAAFEDLYMRDVRTYLIGLAACLALAACPNVDAGDGTQPGSAGASSATCSALNGIYRFTYQLHSGTCGAQPEELLQFNNGKSVPSATLNCQAGGEAMTTACTYAFDRTCAASDPLTGALLGNTHVTGTLSELSDNSEVQGSLDFVLSDTSGQSCEGTYDVTAIRAQ